MVTGRRASGLRPRASERRKLLARHHEPASSHRGAASILIAEVPRLSTVALLAIAIWAFARAYYFAFYVIEHYIDGSYKFAGLWSSIMFLARRPHRTRAISLSSSPEPLRRPSES
jgi:hypothetical protein